MINIILALLGAIPCAIAGYLGGVIAGARHGEDAGDEKFVGIIVAWIGVVVAAISALAVGDHYYLDNPVSTMVVLAVITIDTVCVLLAPILIGQLCRWLVVLVDWAEMVMKHVELVGSAIGASIRKK